MKIARVIALVCCCVMVSAQAADTAPSQDIQNLQHQWALANYKTNGELRQADLSVLASKAKQIADKYPTDPKALVWKGIIFTSYGNELGGLSSASINKQARLALQQAINIDPKVMHGAAYTALGTLYYRTPGWPAGFADSDRAQDNFAKALEIAPNSRDANYYYGEFLLQQKQYGPALVALRKAMQTADDASMAAAAKQRRQQVQKAVDEASAKSA